MSLNVPLGVEIKGEGIPRIKHPSNKKIWYGTSLPWMSIGYELMVTPLQTLTYYNAVANDGVMVKPMFVSAIKEGGAIIEQFDTEIINPQIASESTIDSAQSLLEGVVIRGTAKRVFKDSPYRAAGKTGTAQIAVGGQYNKRNYNASFVGYFPAENPQYSMIVVVNNPSAGRYYGGSVAAPVFREIADNLYSTIIANEYNNSAVTENSSIPLPNDISWRENIKAIYSELNLEDQVDMPITGDWAEKDSKIENSLAEVAFREERVPDVRGMNAQDAIYLLENLGVQTSISGRGKVQLQSIRPGTRITSNTKISLQLGNY